MNFKPKTTRRRGEAEVNLTPLVDVVLQLVLFFMVTAQFAVMPGLKLILPSLSPESLAQTSERLEIAMSATGDIYFEGRPITKASLPGLLRQSGAAKADVVTLISADRQTPHGLVVEVMDTLSREGFKRVVISGRHKTDETNE